MRESFEPHALALRDHFERGVPREYVMQCSDGETRRYSTAHYFAFEPRQSLLHAQALARCQGLVWDVGAGVGRHALCLQRLGHEVLAIDTSPTCVAIMRQRGVERTLCRDVFDIDEGEADSMLFLDDGLGIAGTEERLRALLVHLRPRLAPRGRILCDGSDESLRRSGGRDSRTVRAQLVYGSLWGPPFDWLYLDRTAVLRIAEEAGYAARIVTKPGHRSYVAELRHR